ncbi:hypothetical protein [Nocardia bovistercoris]|uniref:hypothetical protein n=1 Tax=Nocardia bovistercoris TaxID=2785916 RepID=UPI0018ABE382|nr:hypothetical protein [Nocardia bovistercoris]
MRQQRRVRSADGLGLRSFKARVRWTEPGTKKRPSVSEPFETREEAEVWIARLQRKAARGINPKTAMMRLSEYGAANMDLALRGLEKKTLDPYKAGWRKRVVPSLGHLPVSMVTNGAVKPLWTLPAAMPAVSVAPRPERRVNQQLVVQISVPRPPDLGASEHENRVAAGYAASWR